MNKQMKENLSSPQMGRLPSSEARDWKPGDFIPVDSIPLDDFKTGAFREKANIPRFDLICPAALRRVANRYSHGDEKYKDTPRGGDNYTAGIPLWNILQHIYNHLNLYELGDKTDDHLAAAAWGLFTLIHFQEECQHFAVRQDRERREPDSGRHGD